MLAFSLNPTTHSAVFHSDHLTWVLFLGIHFNRTANGGAWVYTAHPWVTDSATASFSTQKAPIHDLASAYAYTGREVVCLGGGGR